MKLRATTSGATGAGVCISDKQKLTWLWWFEEGTVWNEQAAFPINFREGFAALLKRMQKKQSLLIRARFHS